MVSSEKRPYLHIALFASGVSYLTIILFSAGRSALLAFFVASGMLLGFAWGKKVLFALPVLLAIVGCFLTFSPSGESSFSRNLSLGSNRVEMVNQLTSGRLELWMNAIDNPRRTH